MVIARPYYSVRSERGLCVWLVPKSPKMSLCRTVYTLLPHYLLSSLMLSTPFYLLFYLLNSPLSVKGVLVITPLIIVSNYCYCQKCFRFEYLNIKPLPSAWFTRTPSIDTNGIWSMIFSPTSSVATCACLKRHPCSEIYMFMKYHSQHLYPKYCTSC